MSVNKRLLIKSIILSIICISILTIVLDFSRLFGAYNFYNAYHNVFIKRIIVILATLLVWLAGSDGLNNHDLTSMKFVFVFICFGDVFFLLAKPILAIGSFFACQCLLISRHCRGLRCKFTKASWAQKLMLTLLLLSFIILLFFGVIKFYSMAIDNTLIFMGLLYGLVLSLSLWIGLANHILNLFPRENSKIIAMGMLLFYFGDITVGLDGLLWPGPAWLIATSLTWVFYAPAITLLALSCYKLYPSRSVQ
jgi:hypothetical protein